jgi:hypothetical protein
MQTYINVTKNFRQVDLTNIRIRIILILDYVIE